MTAHTAGPWASVGGVIVGNCERREVTIAGDGFSPSAADAARIVACVNACEGMNDPALTIRSLRMDEGAAKEADDLRVQRDELAATLRDADTVLRGTGPLYAGGAFAERVQAVLTKVKP